MNESTPPANKLIRILRRLLIIAACVVTVIALFYAEEDLRGKSAWNKFKHEEEAKGEKFDYTAFVPPPVPDDQNLAMTPLLRPAFDYSTGNDNTRYEGGLRWRDTNAWQHLSNMRLDLEIVGSKEKKPSAGQWEKGSLADLAQAANFYRGNTNYPQSASGNDAEVVLTALNKFEPDLKELRDAAAARPLSRFPIEYNFNPPFAILLPHLAPLKGLISVCELRAVAELELHKTDEAFADLQLAFRLSDSMHDEPFLIDHLVRLAGLSITMQGIREGIVRQAWSDAQLAAFEKQLTSLDLLSDYEHALRAELAFHIRGLEYYRNLGLKGNPLDMLGNGPQTGGTAFNWMPDGWYDQNMLMLAKYYRDYLLPEVDETNRLVKPAVTVAMDKSLAQLHVGPYNVLAKLLLPALTKAVAHSSRTQTFVDQTRVAIAIERYRMAHNEIPDSLNALVPQFLSQIPTDLFDGQPLRYKKNGSDAYVIYSIGWNSTDDGGQIALKPGSNPNVDDYAGDWVWEIPPPK